MASSTFCSHLWNYFIYDVTKDRLKGCCKTNWQAFGDYDSDWNHLVLARQEMQGGGRPQICQLCWQMEDQGLQSFRVQQKRTDSHEYTDQFSLKPQTLEIVLEKTCDLKCVYCGPQFSSRWQQHLNVPVEKFSFSEESQARFQKRIESFWGSLYRINFIGGEPLLQDSFYRIIETLLQIPSGSRKKFRIVTNLNARSQLVDRFISLINQYSHHHFEICVSNEAVGDLAMKVREGLNFERFDLNVNRLLLETSPQNQIYFLTTLNLMNLEGLPEFLRYTLRKSADHQRDIHLIWNAVTSPEPLSPYQNPQMLKRVVHESQTILQEQIHNQQERAALSKNLQEYVSRLESMLTPTPSARLASEK
ncbi:MAG: twitch domain-containing radical SAM protein [Bdellovibrionales bacterium]